MTKVLILDQSKSVRNILRERLEYEGFSAEAVENEAAASALCERIPFDVILSDTECKVPDAGIPFIALSADTSIDTAVKAVRNGAQDFLTKPIDMNRLLQSLHRTIDNPAPAQAPPAAPPVRRRRAHSAQAERIIGVSPEIEHVRQLIDKVAPCEARVLITGENGTGKELVARWLHAKSVARGGPVRRGQLRGHPLRTDRERTVRPRARVPSPRPSSSARASSSRPTEARSSWTRSATCRSRRRPRCCAPCRRAASAAWEATGTSRSTCAWWPPRTRTCARRFRKGNFREDLYHRLAVIVVRVPPLREHAGDIPALVEHFIRTIASEYGSAPKPIDADALAELQRMPWSGNIRELRNVIERLIILSGDRITARDVKEYC